MHKPPRPVSELPEFDASEYLNSEEDVAEYLAVVLEENDPALLAAALDDIAKAWVRTKVKVAQASADAGNLMPTQEVEAEAATWRAEILRKVGDDDLIAADDDATLMAAFTAAAKDNGTTAEQLVCDLMREYVRRHQAVLDNSFELNPEQREYLIRLAPGYIWWKTPKEALQYPMHLVARIMDRGELEDVRELAQHFDNERLAAVLRQAEIDWFHPHSWSYWHYRLGIAKTADEPPPMPKRF